MNKNHYRLVFSRVHGMLVAVEETASSAGKASAGETRHTLDRSGVHVVTQFALRFAAFAALIVAGAMPMWVHAQIVGAGPNAPSVIQTPNGLPQVNINKPGGAGVSLNTYNQFDVSHAGAILNNSPTIVNTQQAGYINGNPNLSAGQAARIIVNQVNSTAASQIKGYVEIAGSRAEIVLANPAGIVVDGGGFINTSRAVLTTGVPQFGADGSLTGYNVSRGLITVQGAGLNASNVDQVDLIARAVQANAAIYAKDLNVIAGAQQVNHDTLAATPIAGDGPASAVAIDVAQLGGMYANRVFLVGNSAGVGVANAGTIAAQAGDLTLQSDGRLMLTGKTTASGNLTATGNGVQNNGTTYAQQNLNVSANGGALSNAGTLAAQQNTTVNADSVSSTGTLGAGVNSDGTVAQSGDLNVTTTGQLSASGHTRAGGNATLQGAGLDLSNSTTSAGSALKLTTTQGDLNLTHAAAVAGGALSATAAGALVNDGGNLSSGAAQTIHAGSVSNVGGQMVSGASLELNTAGAVDNRQGLMQAAGRETITGASMNNSGGRATSLGTDGLSVHVNGALVNAPGTTAQGAAGGVIGSNGTTDVSADTIANQGEFNSKTDLTVHSRTLDNHSGALLAGAKLDTTVVEALNNQNAKISGSTTRVSAASILNDGGSVEGDALDVKTTGDLLSRGGVLRQYGQTDQHLSVGGALDNDASGVIASNAQNLAISASTIRNGTGSIQHAGTGTLDLNAGTMSSSGQALTNGALQVTVDALSNQGKLGTKTDATIRAQSFDNHAGSVAVGAKLNTNVAGTLNNEQGLLSGSTNTVVATTIQNARGTIEGDALGVTTSGDLLNQQGSLQQYGKADQTLSVGGAFHNENGTVATNATNLSINAQSISNDSGKVNHSGTGKLALTTTDAISNVQGQIVTNGDLVSRSSRLDNSQGVLSSQRVANILANAGIVNARGTFYGKDSLTASTQGDYVNSFGSTQSGGSLNVSAGGGLLNDQGILSANGAHGTMDVSASSIVNRSGTFTNAGDGATTLSAATTFDNDAGTAGGNGDVTVNAQRLANTNKANFVAGKAGNFNITQWLDNSNGLLFGGTAFNLNQAGTTVLNNGGRMEGGQDVSVKVASLSNQLGVIRANRDVTVSGSVSGDGEMTAGRNLGLYVVGDYTNGANNRLRADGDMEVSATGTLTNGGTLAAAGAVRASGKNVVNQAGADINSLATTVTATDTLTNAGTIEGDSVTTNSPTFVNTGAVIGNDVLVNATDVRNTGKQAVIAGARKTRVYASNSVINEDGATIYSAGDLEMAKDGTRDASGLLANQTDTITNDSANIEADGNMDIAARVLINKRTSLVTEPGTPQSTSSSLSLWTAGIPIGNTTQRHWSRTFPQWQWGAEADPISGNMAGKLRSPISVEVPKEQVANLDPKTQTFSLTKPIVETYTDNTGCFDFACFNSKDLTREIGKNPTQTYNSIQDNGATYTITFWPDWDPKTQMRPDTVRVRTDLGPDSHDYVETQRTTTTTTTTDKLISASDPAKMQAQGAIRINADGGSITNESSIMAAGGDLVRRATGGTVTDKGTVLQQTVSEQDTSTFYWHQKTGGDTDTQKVNYPVTPLPPTTIAALPAIATSNQTVQTDARSIDVQSVDRLGQTVTGSGVTGGNATGTQLGGLNGQIAGPNTPTGITGQTSRPQTLGNASGGIPDLTLPTNALYTYHPAPGQAFLIATDPRFTWYTKFISSDYMLGQLGLNPQSIIKRLGDGAYESRLIRDQVTQLTGRTFLTGYSDNLAEYTALMNNGVAYSKAFNLAVGVGLTDAQMQQLTTDMVWLVSQDVALPDGTHQTVLVPKLYLAQANTVDLQHSGALVAGNAVKQNATGDVTNSGQIVGDVATTVIGNTIVNRGVIGSGGTTAVAAVQDVRNVSGRIGGVDTVVRAGRDITNETETFGVSGAASSTGLVGSISAQGTRATGVISASNDVRALAGRDVNVTGAAIQSGRDTSIGAGRDIIVGTVSLAATQDVGTRDGLNGGRDALTQHVGSAITAGGNVTTVSGRDTTLTNAAVDAKNDVAMVAGGDLTATAAKDAQSHDERSLGGSMTQHTASSYDETARGTDIHAGNNAVLGAGQSAVASTMLAAGGVTAQTDASRAGNLSISGSSVTTGQTAADGTTTGGATKLVAKGDVNVGAVTETHDSQSWVHDERSGFMSKRETTDEKKSHQVQSVGSTVSGDTVTGSAGRDLTVAGSTVASTHDLSLEAGRDLNITTTQDASNSSHFHEEKKSGLGATGGLSYGSLDKKDTTHDSSVTQNGSLVGSTDGSVSMKAGNSLHITGSDVIAAQDVTGVAKNVTIESALGTTHHDETHEVKQSGFTLAVKAPVIDAVQNVTQQAGSAGRSGDGRAAALHGIAAAGGVADALGAAKGLASSLGPGGKLEAKVELSFGSSQSKTTFTEDGTQNRGSSVKAGGTAAFVATGDKDAGQGNVTIKGSDVNAKDVLLQATNQVNLVNSTDTDSTRSTNKSSSASVGVSFGTGGFGVSAAMSRAHGDANSDAAMQNNTHVNASNTAKIVSGGDTNIVGANVNANKVVADVGGNLNLASVQDTTRSAAHQSSTGGGFSISQGGGSASFSAQSGHASGNYAGVNEQAGIQAGSGGYDINVKGNTDLKGAYIASTATPDKNQLTTGTLSFSDIQNHSEYDASSVGVSAGGGIGDGGNNYATHGATSTNGKNTGGALPLYVNESGSSSATTKSAISDGRITITDKDSQKQDIATLNRDTANLNGKVDKTPDLQQVLSNQGDLMNAATAASEAIAKQIGNYADRKEKAARDAAAATDDPALKAQYLQDAKNWAEGGDNRVALHIAGGALTGGLTAGGLGAAGGAAGAGLSAKLAPELTEIAQSIKDAGPTGNKNVDELLGNVASNLLAGGAGALVGGGTGALTGAAVDRFNRQLNQDEKKAIHDKANGNAGEEKRLTQAACYRVQCWAEFSPNSPQWLANYVDPMDAKDLAPELQWIDSQKAKKGLFDYTLIQQGKDLGLSQFDQFKRGVLGFGEDAKNLPRDVANSHVKLPTDVQQGDANPQIDPNGGVPKTPSGPAGATVTVGAVPCGPGALCPTVNVAPVVTPGGPTLSSGNDQQSGESTGSTPGRVQSHINITNDGIEQIGDRHLDPNINASQFTISESDLRRLLQDPNAVSTSITKEVQTPAGSRYIYKQGGRSGASKIVGKF